MKYFVETFITKIYISQIYMTSFKNRWFDEIHNASVESLGKNIYFLDL